MNETTDPQRSASALPEASAKRGRWPGLVWAVPLAALAIVAFLGIRALADRGIDVVVTFDTANGARVEDTKVIYQGLEAGRVVDIDINDDGRRVDMTLRLDPRAKPALNSSTKFWLVGAKPNLSDINSVKAALAGLTIGVAPGTGGEPTRHFNGLSEPPIVMPDATGTPYVLTCKDLGTAQRGSSLFHHGQEIGKVTDVTFTGTTDFRLGIFVFAPFDKLIRPGTAFWISSPLEVSIGDRGFNASLEHAGALLSGGVEVEFADDLASKSPSPARAEFTLYPTKDEAQAGPSGPQVPYLFTFDAAAGDLAPGAAVRLMGFRVGAVTSVRLNFREKTGAPYTTVTAALYPIKFNVRGPVASTKPEDWRGPTDEALRRLLAQGYRARLVQKPPLVGPRSISLEPVQGVASATLGSEVPALIPSIDSAGGGVDDVASQASQLLAKINRIPLDAIGRDVRQLTAQLNQLAASPELSESFKHLNNTLKQADALLADVKPQVGPLVAKLNQAADEVNGMAAGARRLLGGGSGATQDASVPDAVRQLNDAARSIQSLADYLGRHPEALIKGKQKDER